MFTSRVHVARFEADPINFSVGIAARSRPFPPCGVEHTLRAASVAYSVMESEPRYQSCLGAGRSESTSPTVRSDFHLHPTLQSFSTSRVFNRRKWTFPHFIRPIERLCLIFMRCHKHLDRWHSSTYSPSPLPEHGPSFFHATMNASTGVPRTLANYYLAYMLPFVLNQAFPSSRSDMVFTVSHQY